MERIQVYKVTDGQETWIFDDLALALEYIRTGIEDGMVPPDDGEMFILEIGSMNRADYDALPEQ